MTAFFQGRWDWLTGLFHKPLAQLTLLDVGGFLLTVWLAAIVIWIAFHMIAAVVDND